MRILEVWVAARGGSGRSSGTSTTNKSSGVQAPTSEADPTKIQQVYLATKYDDSEDAGDDEALGVEPHPRKVEGGRFAEVVGDQLLTDSCRRTRTREALTSSDLGSCGWCFEVEVEVEVKHGAPHETCNGTVCDLCVEAKGSQHKASKSNLRGTFVACNRGQPSPRQPQTTPPID